EQFDFKLECDFETAMDLMRAEQRSRPRTFLSTGINSRGRRSRWVSGKRHLAWNRQLRTRRYIRSSELYRLARLHRNGRSASSSGENRWQPFGLTTQIC